MRKKNTAKKTPAVFKLVRKGGFGPSRNTRYVGKYKGKYKGKKLKNAYSYILKDR